MSSVFDNMVECLIEREGATIFHIGKVQYVFAPRPELTGDMQASVCVVISQEHRDYLLKDRMCSQYYRKYEPKPGAKVDMDAAEKAEFEAWRELRKTMTQEELIAMEQKRVEAAQVVVDTPQPVASPGRKKTAVPAESPAMAPPETGKDPNPLAEIF